MLQVSEAAPVKLIAAVLWGQDAPRQSVRATMEKHWGAVDCFSEPLAFSFTDYYKEEMGPHLSREVFAFESLASPALLPELKLEANQIEETFLRADKRFVNIDIGYLDFHKVVLASTKPGAQKIYMGQGIWADLTLMYSQGQFHAFDWTFPDFQQGTYDTFLVQVRQLYKEQLRQTAQRN